MRSKKSARWWNLTAVAFAGLTMLAASLLGVNCLELQEPIVTLGVPYKAQTDGCNDCAPAAIWMWNRYDVHSTPTLGAIGNYIGTTCYFGTHQDDIADGVRHYTDSGDATWVVGGGTQTARDKFFSKQLTSIDKSIPVLPIVQGGFHIGAINGGKWHENSNGDLQWDLVKFHDPLPSRGPNQEYAGSAWTHFNCNADGACEQIASPTAMGGWLSNYNTLGDDVVLGGGGGGGGCGGPCEY